MLLFDPPCASSTLAGATTIHLAFAALRNHRGPAAGSVSSLALIALLLAGAPWVFPGAGGVVVGLGAQIVWFVACEILVPGRHQAAGRAVTPPVTAAATAVRAPAAIPSPPAMERSAPAFVPVPVVATLAESHDIKTIRLARPDDFEFEAGQFVTVRIRVDGKEHVRCYSISSAPGVRGYFEITVQRRGVVSSALHATARPGAMLSIRRPNGRFAYPSADDRPMVLLAGGVGVTPLMSMLRHAIHTEPTRPVTLVYSAQTTDSLAFRDELAAIPRRHPQARVMLTVTRDSQRPPEVRGGRIDAALLRALVPDLGDSLVFVCGPKAMIDDMRALLASLGVPPAQVRHEVFEAAIAAAAREAQPAPARPVAAARAPAAYAMRCAASRTTVPIRQGETLLDAAERAHLSVASLCRAGVCGTCRTRVTEGEVECTSTTLDDRDRADGFVLACVATARTSCTVDL